MQPTDCAVFMKNRATLTPLGLDGREFADPAHATCFVFKFFDSAQRFCNEKVKELHHVRCEIYDAHGLACPPLAVVLHPDFQQDKQEGSLWRRRRKLIMAGLVLLSAALFSSAAIWPNSRDLTIFLA